MPSDENTRSAAVRLDSAPRARPTQGRLRVGLIVNSAFASPYVRDLALWGQSQDELCISHLILQKTPHSQDGVCRQAWQLLRQRGPMTLCRLVALHTLRTLEAFALSFTGAGAGYLAEHLRRFDLSGIVPHTIEVQPIVSKSGRVYRYTDEDLRAVRALGLDLLIRCAPAILRGGVLTVVPLGILSFHHGDNRINRGGPAGFWEVYLRQPTSGFIIQRLTEELDGGHVLLRGSIRTRIPYLLNQAVLSAKSNFHLKRLLKQIARNETLPPPEEPRIYCHPLYRPPPVHIQATYVAMCTWRALRELLQRFLLGRHQHWGVGFAHGDWKSLVMWRAHRLQSPRNHFLADPFVIHANGADYCFVEDFDCRKGRACISAYQLDKTRAQRIGEALVEPFHLSYPYLFRFDGRLYMCPETSQRREIRLYECTDFPLQWKLAKVVMSEVSAADTMIFEHEGKWWLFTNMDPLHRNEYSSELYIFHADSPLSDTWVPHERNPVYIDATRARNGGIVIEQGAVYRMSQVLGFNVYGHGFAVNQICRLTETDFSERRLYEVGPHFFEHISGTHHFNGNGEVCVFDFSHTEACGSLRLPRARRPAAARPFASWRATSDTAIRTGSSAHG